MKAQSLLSLALIPLGVCLLTPVRATGANLDLTAWQTVGVAKDTLLPNDEGTRLPGGAQLFRTVSGNEVTLRLVSTPDFASDPAELSLVEIGTTALAFVREGDSGRIKLVQGNTEPQTVPVSWPLDASGHVAEPLIVEITRRSDRLVLTTQGQVFTYAETTQPTSFEIILSTGESVDWLIQDLGVTTGASPGTGTDSADARDNNQIESSSPLIISPTSAMKPSFAFASTTGDDHPTGASNSSNTADKEKTRRPSMPLELFTPPSVRHGRETAIRAALAQKQQK